MTDTSGSVFQPDLQLVAKHRAWLDGFPASHRRRWDDRLQSAPESAMCEVHVRELLHENGVTVSPNEERNLHDKSPDFSCQKGTAHFLVESTCISIESATKATGLEHCSSPGQAGNYAPLNKAIFNKCCRKVTQCSGLRHPCLIAVGTFHFEATCLCIREVHLNGLLTGEALLTWVVDTQLGRAIGDPYETTKLKSAAFFKPAERPEFARLPISGVIVCGFGCSPPSILGLLHPDPNRAFDPRLLPSIRMGQVELDSQTSRFAVNWPLKRTQ